MLHDCFDICEPNSIKICLFVWIYLSNGRIKFLSKSIFKSGKLDHESGFLNSTHYFRAFMQSFKVGIF